VISAHRMPDQMFEYAEMAKAAACRDHGRRRRRGHLPGMLAAKTIVRSGVPVRPYLRVRTRCCRSYKCRRASRSRPTR